MTTVQSGCCGCGQCRGRGTNTFNMKAWALDTRSCWGAAAAGGKARGEAGGELRSGCHTARLQTTKSSDPLHAARAPAKTISAEKRACMGAQTTTRPRGRHPVAPKKPKAPLTKTGACMMARYMSTPNAPHHFNTTLWHLSNQKIKIMTYTYLHDGSVHVHKLGGGRPLLTPQLLQ